jgi:5-methylthioadenosine/S-adenosylhomocysteine deaminase
VECLRRGVTTVLEAGTVAHPEAVARALRRVGIRGRVGRWGSDSPGMPGTGPAAEVLAAQEETVKAIGRDDTDLVRGWVTLVGHDLATDELFAGAAEMATRLGCGATWHMSPHEQDVHAYAERSGRRPVEHLHHIGALGPHLLLGHALWIDERELEILLDTGTAVAACPAAYLRLGQGLLRASRYAQFARRGGRLALGSDAHNASDAIDVVRAAWLLAALDRDAGGPDPLRADETFALATCAGAAAANLPDVGSIEVGKRADLVVLDGADPRWVPRSDPALQLVYGDGGNAVRDVVVAGRVVVRDREVLTVDVGELYAEAAERATALRARAKLEPRPRWPVRPA